MKIETGLDGYRYAVFPDEDACQECMIHLRLWRPVYRCGGYMNGFRVLNQYEEDVLRNDLRDNE